MKTKFVFKKPKWLRRIASALLDLFSAIILSLVFYFAVDPFTMAVLDGQEVIEQYYSYALETKLYTYDESGNFVEITNLETYDENLTYFYENFTEGKISEYNEKKSERLDLFELGTDNVTYVEKDYDKTNQDIKYQYSVFYGEVRDHCIATYLDAALEKNEGYKKAQVDFSRIIYTMILLSFGLGSLVVYLIIPLINKDNKTIGKIALRLKVVSKVGNGPKPSKSQIVFRQLFTIFFEYVLSISTLGFFGIPLPLTLLFSMSLLFLTKLNQSFHDLCCSTFLVDDYPGSEPINEGDKYEVIYISNEEAK